MTNFNPLNFIANHAGMNLADAIKEAYEQGKRDAQQEQKTGKWIEGRDKRFVKCSKCGMETTRNELRGISLFGKNEPNFCPNCGSYNGGKNEAT